MISTQVRAYETLSSIIASSSSRSISTSLAKESLASWWCPPTSLVCCLSGNSFFHTGSHQPKIQIMDISIFRAICTCCDTINFEGHRVMKGVVCTVYSRARTIALELVIGMESKQGCGQIKGHGIIKEIQQTCI